MIHAKRVTFWVLFLTFIIVPCWWVFHFPFRPELVLRIVPTEAILATRHIAPATRCTELMSAPVATRVAVALGVDPADVADIVEDEGVRRMVNFLGSRYIATAVVPAMGVRGESAFLFGAWIGGYSQLLRWGFADRYLTDFTVHRLSGNRRIWFRSCHDIKQGYGVSLTVHEGVLVGCFSSEPLGVLYVLPRFQRQVPLSRLVDGWGSEEASPEGLDLLRFCGSPFSVVAPLRAALTCVSAVQISTEVDFGDPRRIPAIGTWLLSCATRPAINGNAFDAVLGKSPSMLAAMPVSALLPLLSGLNASSDIISPCAELESLFQGQAPACVFACGGEYSGRIRGMRVPAFGVALRLADPTDGDVTILKVLDVLNAKYGWGLIVTPDSRDPQICAVDSVRSIGFKFLKVKDFFKKDDRLAIAVHDGWLIGLSNVGVLRRVLADARKDHLESSEGSMLRDHSGVVMGWTDLPAASDVFINALAGYTLLSLVQGGGASTKRYDTVELKTAIDVLGQFGEFAFWLYPDALSKLKVDLSFSKDGVL